MTVPTTSHAPPSGSPRPPGRRPVDHLVLPVIDLGTARARHAALGFTVAADARHPFGTENACVYFADGTYLEPLAIGSRDTAEDAARAGNVFVNRDRAYRFRHGEGFNGIAFGTRDALGDHGSFVGEGISAGPVLDFARAMKLPDGSEAMAQFRLAFAADLRSPDFYLFTCERRLPLPVDRSSLTGHANGVTGIAEIVLHEENPSDFQYLLQSVVGERDVASLSLGLRIETGNVPITVMGDVGMASHFGLAPRAADRGLKGGAVVFRVQDLSVTERVLGDKGVAFARHGARIVVAPTPGQGYVAAFEDHR